MSMNALDDKEIEKVLHKIIEKIVKSDPKLNANQDRRDALVKEMKDTLRDQKIEMTKTNLKEPKFINRLFTTMKLALVLNNNKQALDDIKKMFRLKFTPEEQKKKLTMEMLMKKFTPAEMKQIMESLRKLKSDLKDAFKAKPKPGAKPGNEDDEAMQNLTGLLTRFTGTIPVVVQCCLGNGRGFPDWGPVFETSMAQLDRPGRTSDTEFGDPYGLNAIARNNLLSLGDVTPTDIAEVSDAARSVPQNTR